MENYRALRAQACARGRKVIFENDGADVLYYQVTGKEELLAKRMSSLLNTQVDTVFVSTTNSGFGQFTHNTRIGTVFTNRESQFQNNMTGTFIDQGTDYLHIVSDFCKENGLDLYWTMRMNDTHDGSTNWYGELTFATNKIKNRHPEWLLGSRENKPRYGAWSAVNYAVSEIRELAVAFIEEVLDNYDVNGIHLDFFRHPVFFPSTAAGFPATMEEIEMMTGLIQEIKQRADRKGSGCGRPILISVRVPDSVEYSLAVGLDIETWMKEGMIDFLIATSYLKFNFWEYSVQLARKYGVKVYASLDETRVKDPIARQLRESGRCYLARAMNALRAGADGIYLFNYTPRELEKFDEAHSNVMNMVGDMEQLNACDKTYVASVRGVGAIAGGGYPHEGFIRVPVLNPDAAILLECGRESAVDLPIGDDVNWGKNEGIIPEITLGIRFENAPSPGDVQIRFNGDVLAGGRSEGIWTVYELAPETVKIGVNRCSVLLEKDRGVEAKLLDLKVDIHYS